MVLFALILLLGIFVPWAVIYRLRSIPSKNYSKGRMSVELIVLAVLVVPLVTMAATTIYNAAAGTWFRMSHPEPGETYLVNGHKMHINCTGTGSPTIVLDAGLGNDSLIWGGIQPKLSTNTRVCSYDRAGFGLSDSLPAPRDADHVAEELHELLIQAKVTGPVVLMGHSIAGLYIRDYAMHYPMDVAGLIFVDSSTPLQEQNPALKAMDSKRPLQWLWDLEGTVEFIAGVPRIEGQCSHVTPGFDPAAAKLLAEDSCRDHLGAFNAEFESFNRSGQATAHSGPWGALPVLIFSHDPTKGLPATNPPLKLVNVEKAWNQMQENLKKLSTHSRRIIAKGASHYVQIGRADLIEKEVPLFIGEIRGTSPDPPNYGNTTIE
ncbi:MAG: alpha/beta hydrolase [Terracidiphilus sp.]